MTAMIVLGTSSHMLRGLDQLNIFSATRSMINMLLETLYDMTSFLLVFFAMIFIFSSLDMVIHK